MVAIDNIRLGQSLMHYTIECMKLKCMYRNRTIIYLFNLQKEYVILICWYKLQWQNN
jgi:hypothetical protein